MLVLLKSPSLFGTTLPFPYAASYNTSKAQSKNFLSGWAAEAGAAYTGLVSGPVNDWYALTSGTTSACTCIEGHEARRLEECIAYLAKRQPRSPTRPLLFVVRLISVFYTKLAALLFMHLALFVLPYNSHFAMIFPYSLAF